MGYKSDIEIAQECTMQPITAIAEKAGIDDKYLEQYGKYKAKISNELYEKLKDKRAVEFLAGHFAAKEAIFKTLDKEIELKDIEITYDRVGRPLCNIENIEVSISHENDYAMAVALRYSL